MPQPPDDQVPTAHEVPNGTRDISGSSPVAELSPDVQQQLYDINVSVAPHIQQAVAGVDTRAPESIPDLEHKQWVFERSEVAQDIQTVNDVKAPGE